MNLNNYAYVLSGLAPKCRRLRHDKCKGAFLNMPCRCLCHFDEVPVTDYTPTTEQVRIKYSMDEKYCDEALKAEWAAEFDRWLAAHDAEVLREAGQRAYEWWMSDKPLAGMTDEDVACDLAAAARGDGEQDASASEV